MVNKNKKTKLIQQKALIAALKKNFMVISVASEESGVARENHYKWIKKDQKYNKMLEEAEQYLIDLAENTVVDSILERDVKTAMWFLERKARHKGYGTKQEFELSGEVSKAIKIEVIMPKSIELDKEEEDEDGETR